jgi:hypothetical protein
MSVILVSLVAAAIQMALLLLTARIVGIENYSRFSLIISISVFLSAGVSEWLRMIVARHGGSRRRRFREAVLRHARTWIIAMSIGVTLLGLVVAAIILLTGNRDAAEFAAATGITAGGMMVSDMSSAFLRYGAKKQWHYNAYTTARVSLMGGASLIAALLGANGPMVAIAFGIAGMIIGGYFVAVAWPQSGPGRPGLLIRLSGQGWSLATGSIGTNLALMLARVTLGIALPSRVTGSTLLSIDLFSRGGNVLGTALCNWGNRVLLDGAHHYGRTGAYGAFKRFSAVFVSIWFSVVLLGICVCLVIPIFTLHVTQIRLHVALSLPTLAAIALLYLRIFLFDCLLSALNRHREIALIASLTTVFAGIAALLAFVVHNQVAASLMFPGSAAVLTLIYAIRNFPDFAAATDRQALRFALEKIVLLIAAFAAVAVSPRPVILGIVIALILALDARQARLLLATLRPRRERL